MKHTYYVPVFQWGPDPGANHHNVFGRELFCDLESLYTYEEDAVGHYQVTVESLSKDEFDQNYGIKRCGAV